MHLVYPVGVSDESDDRADRQLRVNGTDIIGSAVDSRVYKGEGPAVLASGGAAFAASTVDTQLMAIQIGEARQPERSASTPWSSPR